MNRIIGLVAAGWVISLLTACAGPVPEGGCRLDDGRDIANGVTECLSETETLTCENGVQIEATCEEGSTCQEGDFNSFCVEDEPSE
jgi:hypothetical protein